MYLNDAMLDSGALARRLLAPANNLVPVNLLTRQQASLEDAGTAGWTAGGTGSPTISTSADYTRTGTRSLKITSASAGYANITSSDPSSGMQVSPGVAYTFVMSCYSPVVAASGNVLARIYWYTGSGSASSTAYTSTAFTSFTPGSWQDFRLTAVAPSDAAFAKVWFQWYAVAGSEVVYVDKVGLWEGAGGSWVNGGERLDPSTLGWYWDESVGRRLFVWDTINSRWQMTYGDTGLRDISSLLVNGWTGNVLVRRVGQTVDFVARVSNVAASSTNFISALPSGFRAAGTWRNIIGLNTVNGSVALGYNKGAALDLNLTVPFNHAPYVSETWTTLDAWPTSLPGTASGTIPNA